MAWRPNRGGSHSAHPHPTSTSTSHPHALIGPGQGPKPQAGLEPKPSLSTRTHIFQRRATRSREPGTGRVSADSACSVPCSMLAMVWCVRSSILWPAATSHTTALRHMCSVAFSGLARWGARNRGWNRGGLGVDWTWIWTWIGRWIGLDWGPESAFGASQGRRLAGSDTLWVEQRYGGGRSTRSVRYLDLLTVWMHEMAEVQDFKNSPAARTGPVGLSG
ncbi:hypothetical protein PAAG_12496 [Paracoccidioides lutzii Pb01]|uniref:Uncharacterized protein n=1 Tax=Paracoccidioides lutzii (strain ATCC MYA-826 / Pb01) TaxID=502779 RepID=A0A0A2UZ31_PARBA|nr:hypothetical protein PAAG_12496 [Paracoccidioides lutzii Pb01]KGQ00831.1 hypothetical protein PAAG_12496 [Paracoccidioides lutzii Pb01]